MFGYDDGCIWERYTQYKYSRNHTLAAPRTHNTYRNWHQTSKREKNNTTTKKFNVLCNKKSFHHFRWVDCDEDGDDGDSFIRINTPVVFVCVLLSVDSRRMAAIHSPYDAVYVFNRHWCIICELLLLVLFHHHFFGSRQKQNFAFFPLILSLSSSSSSFGYCCGYARCVALIRLPFYSSNSFCVAFRWEQKCSTFRVIFHYWRQFICVFFFFLPLVYGMNV